MWCQHMQPAVHIGYLSWRSHVWTDVDNDRCGTLPFVFDDDFGFDRYVEYALDVPMYFVYRFAYSDSFNVAVWSDVLVASLLSLLQ